jgi:iron complex outermembrane receptor protein
MFKKIILLCLIALPYLGLAQFQIRGKISDKVSGEALEGAAVQLVGTSHFAISHSDGVFVMNKIPKGNYTLMISYLGYETYEQALNVFENIELVIQLKTRMVLRDEVIISAMRAKENTPTTFSEIGKREIQEKNHGKDLPFILASSPSVVVTSDAGAGIGYTNFSLRGSDISRINVTINGIPMNDAESHSVYFVDLPDLASSLDNIQIQRGVGTSTNGAAAFGGSVNLLTKQLNPEAYATLQSGAGSFNTFKNSVSFGTGLINNFAFDGRSSKISSNGFIDRASSELKSLYFSGAYYGKNDILKFTLLSGKEQTYQAWYGIPKVKLNNDLEGMLDLAADNWWDDKTTNHLISSNTRTFNYYTYDNEVDNYQQDYYQLHWAHHFNSTFQWNNAVFYTRGKGYYEQFKTNRKFADYLMEEVVIGNETINRTDLIQRKWLDNHFYGLTSALNFISGKVEGVIGGAYSIYDGDHYGEVNWAEFAGNNPIRHRWYENNGLKKDGNIFAKSNINITSKLLAYIDLQYRFINYEINGTHDDLRDITQNHKFHFFNPKAGVFYQINSENQVYSSFAIANREPSRGNYRDADTDYQPKPERLYDLEIGYRFQNSRFKFESNFYGMFYKDQLIATGKINNVGDPIMANVAKSYRSGIELSGLLKINTKLSWESNLTFSKNKILDFVHYIDNWDNWNQDSMALGTTNILLSPEQIGSSVFTYKPTNKIRISLVSKYVGKQYIDNTNNDYNSIDAYFVNDLNLVYEMTPKSIKSIEFNLLISNLFSENYETYGWAYNYIYNNEQKVMDGYFPMAPINFMLGLNIKI